MSTLEKLGLEMPSAPNSVDTPPWPVCNSMQDNNSWGPYMTRMNLEEPFLSHLLRITRLVKKDDLGASAAVGLDPSGSGFQFYWNPSIVQYYSDAQIHGLIKHEAFHLMFGHVASGRLGFSKLANIAYDLAINGGIPAGERFPSWLVPGVRPVYYDTGQPVNTPLGDKIVSLPVGKSAEYYYLKLCEDPEVKKEAEQLPDEKLGHFGWEHSESAVQDLKAALKKAVAWADRTSQWGSISQQVQGELKASLSSEVPWEDVLRRFFRSRSRGTRSTTWSRINSTYCHPKYGPLVIGAKKGRESNVVVFLDQSGSVTQDDLELALGELVPLSRRTSITLFNFDTTVDKDSELLIKRGGTMPAVKRTRMGGTKFSCIPEFLEESGRKFDGVIVITDGEAEKPPKCESSRCWVIVPGRKLLFDPDSRDVVVTMRSYK